jgi:uncharacterized protein (TIGR00288 family)
MSNDNRRLDVAVFIDFENIYVSVRDKLDANPNFEMIMDRCEDLGRVVIARAYADWYRYPRVTSALYANGIEPMYVPTYYYDRDMGRTGRAIKNSVDMNLCIDAMKTLFTNTNIAKFVLCTGDRDFIPLVNSIRQQGKEVVIIGIGGAASSHLAQSADEFVFYESLIGKKPLSLAPEPARARTSEKGREVEYEAPELPVPAPREAARERESTPPPREAGPAQPDIFDVLVQAVKVARERDFVCSFGSLKLLMKELTGGEFREDRYRDAAGRPFAKFKDFVMEAERRGKVQVFTSGAMNEVFLPGEDPYKLSRFAMDLKEDTSTPASITPTVEDTRAEAARQAVGGRRRRRRSRGRGQGAAADAGDQNGELIEELDELDLTFAPSDEASEAADARFEELLGRLDADETRSEELDDLDELQLIDSAATEPEPEPAPGAFDAEPAMSTIDLPELEAPVEALAEEPASVLPDESPIVEPLVAEIAATGNQAEDAEAEDAQPAESVPFTDAERALLVELVGRTERALSFVQIHDLLRGARNSTGTGIARTNEELRTLIKQAINNGQLVRSGKGNRVNYRPAPAPEGEAQPAGVEEPTPVIAEPALEAAAELPAAAEPATEGEAKPARRGRSRRKKTETVEAAEPAPELPIEPAPVEVASAPAAEEAPAAPAEAKPARSTRRRKKAAEATEPTE